MTPVYFSPRERKVIALIVLGKTNREIADEIKTSTQCVKNTVKDIYAKTGVRNRIQFVLRYYEKAIVHYVASPIYLVSRFGVSCTVPNNRNLQLDHKQRSTRMA